MLNAYVEVASDLVVVGINPENADMSNPRGERYGEVYYVTVTFDNGKRFAHVDRFQDANEACMLKSDVERFLKTTEFLPDVYEEIRPAYGSEYYQSSGSEYDQIEHEFNTRYD